MRALQALGSPALDHHGLRFEVGRASAKALVGVSRMRLALVRLGVGRPDPAAADIVRWMDSMAHAVRIASEHEASIETFHQMHGALFPDQVDAGRSRTCQNWVLGPSPLDCSYVPPPPELVDTGLEALASFLVRARHEHRDETSLVAALAYAQLLSVHPYVDGNGRMARALTRAIYRAHGVAPTLVPSLAMYFHRIGLEVYQPALAAFRAGQWDRWAEFWERGLRWALGRMTTLAQSYASARRRLERSMSVPGRGLDAAVDDLESTPMLTLDRFRRGSGLSKHAARAQLDRWSKAGLLRPGPTRGVREPTWLVIPFDAALRHFDRPGLDDALPSPFPRVPPHVSTSPLPSIRNLSSVD